MKLPEEVAALCKMVAEPLCEMRDVLPYKTLFSCVTSINRKLEKRFFNIRAEPYLIDEKSWEQIKDSLKKHPEWGKKNHSPDSLMKNMME